MTSLALRNIIFTILQPGIVAGLIPYFILRSRIVSLIPEQLRVYNILGIIIFLIGFSIMFICIRSFAIHGKGTLSPIDRTKRLVVKGLYRFSRNPMYVGVLFILLGEVFYFKSLRLLIYLFIVFVAFYIFILLVEEPRLKKDFGEDYKNYCKRVRRWV